VGLALRLIAFAVSQVGREPRMPLPHRKPLAQPVY
jgi:hypothetical protein